MLSESWNQLNARLAGDLDPDLIAHLGHESAQAELRALDSCGRIEADRGQVRSRIDSDLAHCDLQSYRPRRAMEGEVAGYHELTGRRADE